MSTAEKWEPTPTFVETILAKLSRTLPRDDGAWGFAPVLTLRQTLPEP